MTSPWLTIIECPDCGGDKVEVNKLPAKSVPVLVEPCKCERERIPEKDGERE